MPGAEDIVIEEEKLARAARWDGLHGVITSTVRASILCDTSTDCR